MRQALSTLPWVEQGTIDPDVGKQQVTFAAKDKKRYKYEDVKQAIEGRTNFKVGKVLSGPVRLGLIG